MGSENDGTNYTSAPNTQNVTAVDLFSLFQGNAQKNMCRSFSHELRVKPSTKLSDATFE